MPQINRRHFMIGRLWLRGVVDIALVAERKCTQSMLLKPTISLEGQIQSIPRHLQHATINVLLVQRCFLFILVDNTLKRLRLADIPIGPLIAFESIVCYTCDVVAISQDTDCNGR